MTHINADISEDEVEFTQEDRDKQNEVFIKHTDWESYAYDEEDENDEDDEIEFRCDGCDATYVIDDEGQICKHTFLCCDCQFERSNNTHYGTCIYCIMDNIKWGEEWDSWSEVVDRGKNITLYGMRDMFKYKQGYIPVSGLYNEVGKFTHMYQMGVEIARTIIYERDDMKIVENIEKQIDTRID